jgi:hypothetical protein
MWIAGNRLESAFGCILVVVLAIACGGSDDYPAGGRASGPSVRTGAASSVDSEEEALAAVREHLSQITSCQVAQSRFEKDFAQGKFVASQVLAYNVQRQSPVWEVALATSGLHIPYLYWFVEQSDGTVLASISAATYYESPLLHMCGQIYSDRSGEGPSLLLV